MWRISEATCLLFVVAVFTLMIGNADDDEEEFCLSEFLVFVVDDDLLLLLLVPGFLVIDEVGATAATEDDRLCLDNDEFPFIEPDCNKLNCFPKRISLEEVPELLLLLLSTDFDAEEIARRGCDDGVAAVLEAIFLLLFALSPMMLEVFLD